MPDVVDQLRSYGEAVEQQVEPVAPSAPRNDRPLLVAAAVLVVVAGIVGAVWVLRAGGEDAEAPFVSTVPEEEGSGWQTLDPGPLAPRAGSAVVWTGEELVVWGGSSDDTGEAHDDGAAYDPATGAWRVMADPPIDRGGLAGGVWTGEEVLTWSTEVQGEADDLPPWTVLAWNPATDTWRRAGGQCARGTFSTCPTERPSRPMGTGLLEPVWTGAEAIDTGTGWAYDPATDVWRTLPERPILGTTLAGAWTGDRLVVLVANRSDGSYPAGEAVALSYDPTSDAWEALPPTGVGENGVDLTWDGERLVVLDYEMRAGTHRPGDDAWEALPPLPLRFYECAPQLAPVGGTVLAQHCSGEALLTDDRAWAIRPPDDAAWGTMVPIGDRLLAWSSSDYYGDPPGSALRSYRPPEVPEDDLALARTVPIGTVLLDLPGGARLTDTSWSEEAGGLVTHLGFELALADDRTCTLESTYASIQSEIRIRNDASTVDAVVGRFPLTGVDVDRDEAVIARFPAGAMDDRAHALLEESTSDVLDLACPTASAVETVLDGIHR